MEAETYPATQTNIETPVEIRGDGEGCGRKAKGCSGVWRSHKKTEINKKSKASLQSNKTLVGWKNKSIWFSIPYLKFKRRKEVQQLHISRHEIICPLLQVSSWAWLVRDQYKPWNTRVVMSWGFVWALVWKSASFVYFAVYFDNFQWVWCPYKLCMFIESLCESVKLILCSMGSML